MPNILHSRSAVSRLSPRMLYIGDITDQAAVDYLTCMCPNVTKHHITAAVRLVSFNEKSCLEQDLFTDINGFTSSMPLEDVPVMYEVFNLQITR